MEKIEFNAHFGNIKKHVEISQPHGNADGGFHVMIDNFYYGLLVKIKGEWCWFHNKPDWFTSDEIQILGKLIDNSQ